MPHALGPGRGLRLTYSWANDRFGPAHPQEVTE